MKDFSFVSCPVFALDRNEGFSISYRYRSKITAKITIRKKLFAFHWALSVILYSHNKLALKLSRWVQRRARGCLHDTGATFALERRFTPVPSHGSIFVYMIPPQNVMPARVTPAWVHSGSRTGARISLRYEISQRYHVNAKRPPISVWNRSAGRLERVAHA